MKAVIARAVSVICAFGMAALTHVGVARAQDSSAVTLDVQGTCPAPELVRAQLAPLLKDELAGSDQVTARVVDEGASYRVQIGEAARSVDDSARQCLERARVVAVFIALNVPKPAPIQAPAAAPPPSRPRSAEPPPPPPPRPHRALALRALVGVDVAPGASATAVLAGGGLSAQLDSWSVSILGAASSSTAPYQSASQPRFELRRVPLAILVGRQQTQGFLRFGAEAGLGLDLLGFRGQAVPNPDDSVRLNLGARIHGLVRLQASRRLQAELIPSIAWFPRTYVARIEPTTELAETPKWWIGFNLGLKYEVWTL